MRLAVLGSMPAAVVCAAWASATAGDKVTFVSGLAAPGLWSPKVHWGDSTSYAQVERIRLGDTFEADAYLLVATRDESIELVRLYADAMRGCPVVVAPGGFGLVGSITDVLDPDSLLGQVPGFPVIGRVDDDGVRVGSIKRQLPLGALRAEDSSRLLDVFRTWFPDLAESTIVETTLSITNHVVHPPLLLVNAARTELADGYLLYRQGVSAGAARLIEHVDAERLALLDALGQDTTSFTGWMQRYYGDQGLNGDTLEQMLSTLPAFAASVGPDTLTHRFVTEDVIGGVAPMEELARRCGIETPHMTAMITTLSAICGRDLRTEATALADAVSFAPTAGPDARR